MQEKSNITIWSLSGPLGTCQSAKIQHVFGMLSANTSLHFYSLFKFYTKATRSTGNSSPFCLLLDNLWISINEVWDPAKKHAMAGRLWGGIKVWIFGCCLKRIRNLSKIILKNVLHSFLFFSSSGAVPQCMRSYTSLSTLSCKAMQIFKLSWKSLEGKTPFQGLKNFIKLQLSTLYNLLTYHRKW